MVSRMTAVKNRQRRPAANTTYAHVQVLVGTEIYIDLLLTNHELRRAILRADRNPEDLPKALDLPRVVGEVYKEMRKTASKKPVKKPKLAAKPKGKTKR